MEKVQSHRVAIFGSGGQLGVELKTEFTRRGYAVTGFERADVDITDAAQVEQCLARCDPAIVLNAAAYNQVDIAEKEPQSAYLVNGLAVRNLAVACRQVDARLVHFSTDYVFDGLAGRALDEVVLDGDGDDSPGPLIQPDMDVDLVAAGDVLRRGNFVELMLRLAAGGQPIKVVEDHVASPTFAPALASRTADLVERGAQGLFHIGGGVPISWFEWAGKIFAAAGVQPPLKPTNEREFRTAARRPKYSALSNSKMESLGIESMPSLDQAIGLYLLARSRRVAQGS